MKGVTSDSIVVSGLLLFLLGEALYWVTLEVVSLIH